MKVARMIIGSICCDNVADVILYLERKPTSLQLPNNKKKLGSCSELFLDKKTKMVRQYSVPEYHMMYLCHLLFSVTSKKSPNVYKSCPKMILLGKLKDFDTFTKIA